MSKSENSGTSWNFSHFLSGIKIPEGGIETVMAAQRRNMEALHGAGKVAYEGVQAVAKRQAEMVREMFDRGAKASEEVAEVKTPEEGVATHAEHAKKYFEMGVANARELSVMMTKTAEGAFGVMSRRVGEGYDEMKGYATRRRAKATDTAAAKTETPVEMADSKE